MAKIELKQPVVQEITDLLNGAATAVVVDYRGLTVEQDTRLRKALREAGVTYKVYKNTMIRLATKGTEFEALDPDLEGPTALAVSKDDATAAARVLFNFAKTADKLELKAGIVEGVYYDTNGIKSFLEDFLEVCSPLLQTSLVCLIRSLRRHQQRLNKKIRSYQ